MSNMDFNLSHRGRIEFCSAASFSCFVLVIMVFHLFSSCSHCDYYYDTDLAPVLSVSRDGRVFDGGTVLTDSVKVGSAVTYNFSCTDTHLYDPEVFFSSFESFCEYEVSDGKFVLNVLREGVVRGALTGRDIYGRESSVEFSVSAFANRPPVARCEVSKVGNLGDYEVKIDMGASKDGDAEFGGRLVMYEYTITSSDGNVYNVQTELSCISYIFKQSGLEKVQCRVCDSDGVWSDWVSEYVQL